MIQAFAGGDGRVLGRSLLTLAKVITAAWPQTGMTRTFSTSAGRRMPASTA